VVDDADTHAELRYRPVGVVGAIGPWNWPMMAEGGVRAAGDQRLRTTGG
jgi:acyl-CoA reductase-like NAD-dependent aldehyde dehydrogenase